MAGGVQSYMDGMQEDQLKHEVQAKISKMHTITTNNTSLGN